MLAPKRKATALKRYRVDQAPTLLEKVELNEIILCKMTGFCEWPAKVLSIDGNRIHVQFYGDKTTACTSIGHVFSFEQSAETIIRNLKSKKRPLYAKSVREAEIALKIPSCLSLTKHCNNL